MKISLKVPIGKSTLFIGMFLFFNFWNINVLFAQRKPPVSCKDIITRALGQFNNSLSQKEDFKDEWNFFYNVVEQDINDTTTSKHPNTDNSFFVFDTIILTTLPPYLQEPYNMPDGMPVENYIRNHNDSLYFPFLQNWIVNESDVFKKRECEKFEEIVLPLTNKSDSLSDKSDAIHLNASISEIWANKDLVSVGIDYSYPPTSPLYSPGYYFTTVLVFCIESLKLYKYGIGISSGARAYDYIYKIPVTYSD